LTAAKGRYNNTVEFEYDSVGRPSSETLMVGGEEYTVGYGEYDAAGRLCELDYPDGSAVWRSYTKRHHFDEVDCDSAGVYANRQSVADFTYDDGMRETARALGNGLSVARTYGRDDNLVTEILVETAASQDDRQSLSFRYNASTGYDANKNVIRETRRGVMAHRSLGGYCSVFFGWNSGCLGSESEREGVSEWGTRSIFPSFRIRADGWRGLFF
jgi:hypothetical protein